MSRNESLDGLKYLLICLVIIGHFIEPSRYTCLFSSLLYSFIYAIHMPLFIWMSGYFYKKRSVSEELKKSTPLLEICLISHLCFCLIKYGRLSIRNLLLFSYSPSWFLLSLFFWRLVTSFLLNKRLDIKQLLLYSVVLECFSFLLLNRIGGVLSIMRTIQFYPLFVLGICSENYGRFFEKGKKSVVLAGVIALIVIIMSSSRLQHQFFFQRGGIKDLMGYTEMGILPLITFRYTILLCSLFLSAAVLFFTHKSSVLKSFSLLGQNTLFIYFGQTILYPLVLSLSPDFFQSILFSIVAILFLSFVARYNWSRIIMMPVSSLIKFKTSVTV